ncbi:hypothetical protein [Methylobacillus sp.]|uniref:hypothetical protein n=1 Tax=Methylobacillus sp. TaxID=56818 RepID=UPI0012BE3C9C|nr:hypothetical protein [Methylobacillus sp.]MPS48562.1 hypothetical protein [Methylobacillus sp.]
MYSHLELLEALGLKATLLSYGGAFMTVGSGVIVVMGLEITQTQIAFFSMLIGAFVGITSMVVNFISNTWHTRKYDVLIG